MFKDKIPYVIDYGIRLSHGSLYLLKRNPHIPALKGTSLIINHLPLPIACPRLESEPLFLPGNKNITHTHTDTQKGHPWA